MYLICTVPANISGFLFSSELASATLSHNTENSHLQYVVVLASFETCIHEQMVAINRASGLNKKHILICYVRVGVP